MHRDAKAMIDCRRGNYLNMADNEANSLYEINEFNEISRVRDDLDSPKSGHTSHYSLPLDALLIQTVNSDNGYGTSKTP